MGRGQVGSRHRVSDTGFVGPNQGGVPEPSLTLGGGPLMVGPLCEGRASRPLRTASHLISSEILQSGFSWPPFG